MRSSLSLWKNVIQTAKSTSNILIAKGLKKIFNLDVKSVPNDDIVKCEDISRHIYDQVYIPYEELAFYRLIF